MRNFSSVLLQRYNPDRAQLGFKTLEASLPEEHVGKVKKIMGLIGPFTHQQAADEILMLIEAERNWIRSVWLDEPCRTGTGLRYIHETANLASIGGIMPW